MTETTDLGWGEHGKDVVTVYNNESKTMYTRHKPDGSWFSETLTDDLFGHHFWFNRRAFVNEEQDIHIHRYEEHWHLSVKNNHGYVAIHASHPRYEEFEGEEQEVSEGINGKYLAMWDLNITPIANKQYNPDYNAPLSREELEYFTKGDKVGHK